MPFQRDFLSLTVSKQLQWTLVLTNMVFNEFFFRYIAQILSVL